MTSLNVDMGALFDDIGESIQRGSDIGRNVVSDTYGQLDSRRNVRYQNPQEPYTYGTDYRRSIPYGYGSDDSDSSFVRNYPGISNPRYGK
jgi:hypothetical protein